MIKKKLKEVIRRVKEAKREEVLEKYVPKPEIPALKKVNGCETPGCNEPKAPDQPAYCATHLRRN